MKRHLITLLILIDCGIRTNAACAQCVPHFSAVAFLNDNFKISHRLKSLPKPLVQYFQKIERPFTLFPGSEKYVLSCLPLANGSEARIFIFWGKVAGSDKIFVVHRGHSNTELDLIFLKSEISICGRFYLNEPPRDFSSLIRAVANRKYSNLFDNAPPPPPVLSR